MSGRQEMPWRIGDWMTVPMAAQVGGARGTHHHARVTNVDGDTSTVTIDARPLKWPGAPRYWWKRYGRKWTRKAPRLSRRVHRARRKAGQLT